ncbi:Ras family gtpase, partial [Globisporangium splendens]
MTRSAKLMRKASVCCLDGRLALCSILPGLNPNRTNVLITASWRMRLAETLKVFVVGNGNVGKTSMTTRYAKGRYTGNYKKTIGVDFMEKSVELRDLGETVNLMVWDAAGQEEFDALTSRYYKGAGAVIYVFSTVDRDSFDDLPKWKRKVEDECGQICQVLVHSKIDLIDDDAMSRSEVEDMADFTNIRLFRSCVQDNVNVKEVFEHLCRRFLKQGGSGDGGGDESRHAVADITTLSERTGLKKNGSSLHHHHRHSSSSDLFHSSSGQDLRKSNGATREKATREPDNREEGSRPPTCSTSCCRRRMHMTRFTRKFIASPVQIPWEMTVPVPAAMATHALDAQSPAVGAAPLLQRKLKPCIRTNIGLFRDHLAHAQQLNWPQHAHHRAFRTSSLKYQAPPPKLSR